MAYNPDGKLLATAGYDGSVRIWEADTGRLERVLLGHTKWVSALAWSPDGKNLASASWDQTVRLWHLASGLTVRILDSKTSSVQGVAWSPDGRFVASVEQQGAVRLWDLAGNRCADAGQSPGRGQCRDLVAGWQDAGFRGPRWCAAFLGRGSSGRAGHVQEEKRTRAAWSGSPGRRMARPLLRAATIPWSACGT